MILESYGISTSLFHILKGIQDFYINRHFLRRLAYILKTFTFSYPYYLALGP